MRYTRSQFLRKRAANRIQAIRFRSRKFVRPLGPIFIAAAIAATLWAIVVPIAGYIGGESVATITDPEKRAGAENSVRQTLLGAAGGSIALIGLAYTARTFYLSRRGQVTDRFTRAVSSLSSSYIPDRVAAIYSLEHVMQESAADHDSVVSIICAHIRDRTTLDSVSPLPAASSPVPSRKNRHTLPRLADDVDAGLIVLGRRPPRRETQALVLTGLDLRGANLGSANLRGAFLTRTRIEGSYLRGADLTGAVLAYANISGCNLRDALLNSVDLTECNLDNTQLSRAKLRGVQVKAGQLSDRQIREVAVKPAVTN